MYVNKYKVYTCSIIIVVSIKMYRSTFINIMKIKFWRFQKEEIKNGVNTYLFIKSPPTFTHVYEILTFTAANVNSYSFYVFY